MTRIVCAITMPKLNRWLITSMIEDMREVTSVANEMCSWIGKVEYLSWRFPTKSARNVNAMAIVENHKGSAGELYILILEMAYDRMHFVLRLVVEFMEGYPFIEEFFQVNKVERPRNMSLANVVQALWQRLESIPETITRNMIITKHVESSVLVGRKSRGSQAFGSLLNCESCSNASKAVKDMTSIIGTALKEINLSSVIFAERELIRSELFEKTQWTVMTKLTEAIDADVKTLVKTILETRDRSEAVVEQHETAVKSFSKEVEIQRIEKKSLQMKITETAERLIAVESQLHELKDIRVKIIGENRALKESLRNAEEKLSNLEILLAATVQRMSEMAEGKMGLENEMKNLNAERQASIVERENLEKKLGFFQDEKLLREKQFDEEVDNLKKKHAEVVENLQGDSRPSAFAFVDGLPKDSQIQTDEKINGIINLISKGDPEVDMTQQLASNEEAIERLERQNERLSRTLSRLKEHRRNIFKKDDKNLY